MILSNSGRILFNSYNVTATSNYVYNSDGSVDSDAGWVSAKADSNVLAINLSTLTASSLSFRIEGRFDTYNKACEIYSKTLTTTHDIDEVINIAEKMKEVRVGVKVGNSATPNTISIGLCNSEVK